MKLKAILLFGMPRSGTTWLGKVFDSHPCTLYRHEPDSGGALDASIPLMPSVEDADRYRDAAAHYVDSLKSNRLLRVTGKLPVFPKAYQGPLAARSRQALLLGAKAASRWIRIGSVPEFIRPGYEGELFLAWKSIESLGRLGVFARALPEARAIHIIRHPCGYVSSVLGGEASGRLPGAVPGSEDYGIFQMLLETAQARRRGRTLEHLRSLHPVERLAWRWLISNEKALDDLDGLANGHTVLYEDLCRNPGDAYRGLFEFAGLSWDRQTVDFIRDSTSNEKSAYFSVFKDPQRAAAGWKHKLAEDDQARVLAVVSGSRAGALYEE